MKSNSLDINDLHKIRYDNFANTEKMTPEELIAYTKTQSEIIKQRLKKDIAKHKKAGARL